MANKKRIVSVIISALAVLVVGAWLAWVVTYNRRIKALDLVPAEYYPMNTFVELGDNYCYGNYYDGLSICANDYRIIDTDAYLEEKGLSEDDFDYLTDKISIVDLTVRYRQQRPRKKKPKVRGSHTWMSTWGISSCAALIITRDRIQSCTLWRTR